jgi:predicted Zn-dependent peptidase
LIKKTVLPNGVRIVTEAIPYVHSVSLGYWVETGSKFELPNEHGASHFIEHMFFKGTQNRTAKNIAESLENVGGQLNAFTSKENTCYYFKVLKEDLDLGINVLTDIFLNSEFKVQELEKEKNVILEEISMYEDTPDELVHDLLQEIVIPGHPLGKNVLGTEESIASMNRDILTSYITDRYIGSNIVIAAAGKIDHEEIVTKVEKALGKIPSQGRKYDMPTPKYNCENFIKEKDVEQIHLNIITPGLNIHDEQIYAMHVLNSILGGGMSSRLFQEIREQRGLAYSIYSHQSAFLDFGLFGVYAAVSVNNVQEVTKLVLQELSKIKLGQISDTEITNNKAQLKGGLLLGLENVGSRMSRLGRSELVYGRVINPEEIVQKIMDVKKEDILAIAERLFIKENICIVAIAPKNSMLNPESLLENTY